MNRWETTPKKFDIHSTRRQTIYDILWCKQI